MSHEYKVGDRVRYRNERRHHTEPEYYPAPGTVGTIVDIDEDTEAVVVCVQWPEGSTSIDDLWWCNRNDVAPVEDGREAEE